jgi:hypothetical protein
MGPPPIGDSEKLREFSRQISRDRLATVCRLQAAMAPMKPTSSARVSSTPMPAPERWFRSTSNADSAAATPARSSQAGA